ncbi:MAG TPA: hypothetical protein VJP88_01795, partial [Caulobacteraceae bacterium]|nr:hypothetical protein [Caulobacteraceae bacterium]
MSRPRKRVQAMAIAAAVVGLLAAAAIVNYFKAGAVLSAMARIGLGGFAAAIAAQVAIFLLLGPGWQVLAPAEPASKAPVFVWCRLIREAASDVLPFSQIGGFVVSGRAAVLGGISTAAALGSSLVDATVEVVAQMIYTLIGLAILAHKLGLAAGGHELLYSIVGSVVLAGVLAA